MTPLPVPGTALAVGAHRDDVEFGTGGLLPRWAAAGTRIHHLICTDGSKGSWDPAEDTARLVAVRQEEQRHVEDITGYVDTKVTALLAHRSQLRSTMDIDDLGDETAVARFAASVAAKAADAGADAGFGASEAFKLLTDL